jgi:hypothetical protein
MVTSTVVVVPNVPQPLFTGAVVIEPPLCVKMVEPVSGDPVQSSVVTLGSALAAGVLIGSTVSNISTSSAESAGQSLLDN